MFQVRYPEGRSRTLQAACAVAAVVVAAGCDSSSAGSSENGQTSELDAAAAA